MDLIRNGMNKTIAECLSVALFGLVFGLPVRMIYVTVISLILVYVFEKFESVIPGIIIHMASNFVGVIMSAIPVDIAENYIFIGSYFIIMSVIIVLQDGLLIRKRSRKQNCLKDKYVPQNIGGFFY